MAGTRGENVQAIWRCEKNPEAPDKKKQTTKCHSKHFCNLKNRRSSSPQDPQTNVFCRLGIAGQNFYKQSRRSGKAIRKHSGIPIKYAEIGRTGVPRNSDKSKTQEQKKKLENTPEGSNHNKNGEARDFRIDSSLPQKKKAGGIAVFFVIKRDVAKLVLHIPNGLAVEVKENSRKESSPSDPSDTQYHGQQILKDGHCEAKQTFQRQVQSETCACNGSVNIATEESAIRWRQRCSPPCCA